MIESEHGLKLRLQQLLSNLREGTLHLRRLIAHKITAGELFTDTISEQNSASGITVDGVKLKDSQPYCDVINEKTAAAGVTVDGVKLKDSEPYCDVINEKTATAGVTIDSVLLKDGVVAIGDVAFDDTTSDPLAVGDAASDGTENSVARKDHVHPTGGTAGGDLGGTYPNPTVDDGADSTAIHDNVAGEIVAVTEKATPVANDEVIIEDSADSNNKKSLKIGNIDHDTVSAGTIASHDTTATGANLTALTDTSDADALHAHGTHGVTHNAVHGISKHTEHANWKLFYSDASGDEQEIALGANGTVLTGTSATGAPAFEAADEHSHTNDHAQVHGPTDHTEGTAWRLVYQDASGDEQEIALGADGQVLTSTGAATAPAFEALPAAGAHAILDGSTHSDSVADAVTRGSLIYGNSTPKWDELTVGAANTVLVSDSTDLSWSGSPSLSGTLSVDTIAELTGAAGVTLDGLLLKDETIVFDEIAIPAAPSSNDAKVFAAALTGNDSLTSGATLTGLYARRPDGLMVKLNDDFPYSTKMRHPYSASAPWGDADEPPMENSWSNWSSAHSVASFTKDFLGCVWVQGVVDGGTVGANTFTMPEGHYNTAGHVRWPTISNDAFGILDLRTDGIVYANTGSNTWFSLSNMAFPDVNRITWHAVGGGGEPAFQNSWVNYGDVWDVAAFAKDALGRVWIKGLVKSGDDGVAVFTLPAGYRPTADINVASMSDNNVIAQVIVTAGGLVSHSLIGAGTNAWASITVNFLADGAASWTAASFENSWVNFGGVWDTAAYFKDAAGIVHIKGVIKDGTIGQDAFTLPVGYRPKQALQFGTISNAAIGRIQVNNVGEVQPTVGNNGWFSVHCSFVAEQ